MAEGAKGSPSGGDVGMITGGGAWFAGVVGNPIGWPQTPSKVRTPPVGVVRSEKAPGGREGGIGVRAFFKLS